MASKANPNYSTRIQPGEVRNPKGRPRKAPTAPSGSAYDVLLNRRISVMLGGSQRELSFHEALQRRTLQAAFDGKRMAVRTVLRWIHEREQARPARRRSLPILRFEYRTPASVDQALLILKIASEVKDQTKRKHFLQLQPWAVTSALARIGSVLSAEVIIRARERTQSPEMVRWPGGNDVGFEKWQGGDVDE